ncbi:MAG: hypothetical protein KTR14_00770, partial [Vampirovibrio sp.]|nr:hypothetical protein [Vampirovibrio sp.]
MSDSFIENIRDSLSNLSPETLKAVFTDMKVLGALAVLGVILYMFVYDFAFQQNVKKLTGLDQQITQKKSELSDQQLQSQNFGSLVNSLSGLQTHLIVLEPGEDSVIAATSEYDSLIRMAEGVGDYAIKLDEPHNRRRLVSKKALAKTTTAFLEKQASSEPLPLVKYQYNFQLSGTYPALMDFVNQLIGHSQLIQINEIVITTPGAAGNDSRNRRRDRQSDDDSRRPDPVTEPDYPVKLVMDIDFSILMHAKK